MEKNKTAFATIFRWLLACGLLFNVECTPPKDPPSGVPESSVINDVDAAKAKINKLKKNFDVKTDYFSARSTYMPKKMMALGMPYMEFPYPYIDGNNLRIILNTTSSIRPNEITIRVGNFVKTEKCEFIFCVPKVFGKATFYHNHLDAEWLLRTIIEYSKEIQSQDFGIRYSQVHGQVVEYVDLHSSRTKNRSNNVMVQVITETLELYDALQIVKNASENQAMQ